MLLLGATSTGNGTMWLQFVGVASDPETPTVPLASYTGYDNAAGKTATYTNSTGTLRFNSLYGNAGKAGVELTFTAFGTDLVFSMDGLDYQTGIQALALVTPIPEPSAYALGIAGILGLVVLVRRRRTK